LAADADPFSPCFLLKAQPQLAFYGVALRHVAFAAQALRVLKDVAWASLNRQRPNVVVLGVTQIRRKRHRVQHIFFIAYSAALLAYPAISIQHGLAGA
jgi:transcriptional regulator of aromatic amino acid metabolism